MVNNRRKDKVPDWLGPREEVPPPPQAYEKKENSRRRRYDDDSDDEQISKKKKKGVKCGPILLLLLLVVPAAVPVVIDVFTKLQYMGFLQVPDFNRWVNGNRYRPCLQEFYADWAPEKLGNMDSTLAAWEGREKQLFTKLGKKYGKKANFATCIKK